MAGVKETIWSMQPHTEAKHRILRGYLDAWFRIVSRVRRARRVLYLDGFAGPGSYLGGEVGSPIVAIDAAVRACHSFQVPVRLAFIEQDRRRHAHLASVVAQRQECYESIRNLEIRDPIRGDCEETLKTVLDEYEEKGREFGPALLFLDQFGYSDVSLELIGRLMGHRMCEVFSYLHADGIIRFLESPSTDSALDKAFGGDAWRAAVEAPTDERANRLAAIYGRRLREAGNARFVWTFSMFDEHDRLLYWLFFCTNNRKGLVEMKRSMAKVDGSGRFRFSDATNPLQQLLFSDAIEENWLDRHLVEAFQGQTVTVDAIELFVLQETPLVTYKKALGRLEKAGAIAVLPSGSRRRGRSFSDPGLLIQFV